MSLLMRLSFRNLWRNKRRTLLTMSGMALSTALLIWVMGLIAGTYADAIESVTGLYYGHAKITAPHYLDERDIALNLDEASLPPSVRHDPHVKGVASRVRGFMLLSSGEGDQAKSQAAELLGIDPREEEAVSGLAARIASGTNLTSANADGILLGKTLAQRLGATLGSEVIAMGQAVDGSTAPGIFHVAGLLNTGDTALDGSLALVGRKTLQAMLGMDGRVHEWVLHLDSPMISREWAKAAQAKVTDAEVAPWQRLLPVMANMIDKSGVQKAMTAVIFYFAVILITVNTMYMAQLERLREFAVMGAIGLKPRRLMSLIVLEGAMMSGIAALAG
ncbi:MAG TPA: ABC transporter permease, partial [Stenomitos sp.]